MLERKVVLYSFDTLRKIAAFDSYDNANGLCAVSTDLSSLIVAVPTHVQGKRSVQIYRYLDRDPTLQPSQWGQMDTTVVPANHEPVGGLALNITGTLLASGT